ncbi:hypothetical protein ACFSHT_03710 [Paraburkholderia silviterrae]|uniref:Uncharacterized protein n=1 Tax=Paraburkholderia silviterrae TaxID=2528715 RepID=A0A4R5M564_9BURK|nr:hypothetical protein [Paraburkholderia silviterrae]TDG21021.1 hypothetical protein EYW47_24260 [Paraburkholderia silviterrae]
MSAELTSDGNPADLVATGALTKMVTAATVTSATSTLNSVLAKLLAQNGLNASFDPISGPFTPNHTGADAVIDSVVVTPSPAGGLQIMSIANMGVSVPLSQSTSTATVLSPPPYPVGYLSTLLTQLGQCLAGTTSACSSAIDAGYLEYGVSKFQTEHPGISASGTTITGVTTLAYFPGGTFPNISGESSLTAPPTGGQKTSGNTSYYRWSWQPMLSGGKLIAPTSNLGQWYGSASIAASNLPVQYELYTVTLYDSTGKQIGTPQSVINTAPPMTAAAGPTTVWPVLSSGTASTALAAGAAIAISSCSGVPRA